MTIISLWCYIFYVYMYFHILSDNRNKTSSFEDVGINEILNCDNIEYFEDEHVAVHV